jgi:hypothetical protein
MDELYSILYHSEIDSPMRRHYKGACRFCKNIFIEGLVRFVRRKKYQAMKPLTMEYQTRITDPVPHKSLCIISLFLLLFFAPLHSWSAEEAPLVLTGGTVIDVDREGNSTADIQDAVVVIRNGKIAALGTRQVTPIPPGSNVLRMNGKFIVPGLVDSFGSMPGESFARAYLSMGVTSVVCCLMPGSRRSDRYEPTPQGPRVYPARLITGKDTSGYILKGRELSAQVDALKLQGTKILLLYYNHTPDQVMTITKRARTLGLGTFGEFGHTSYAEALKAGVDAFLHTTRYSAELLPPPMKKRLDDFPFGPAIARRNRFFAALKLNNNPALDDLSASYARGNTTLLPTLALYYTYLPGHANPWKEKAAALLDPDTIDHPVDKKTGLSESVSRNPYLVEFAEKILSLEACYLRGGVKRYLAGSATPVNSTMPGISLHYELELLVRIGMTPRQALAAATGNFGSTFHFRNIGQIKEGYDADLLVVNRNPLQDIKNLKDIDKIFVKGTLIQRRKLLTAGTEQKGTP